MIRIFAEHRKPMETSFHKECRNTVRREFYFYMDKRESKGYVNNAHTCSIAINNINEDMRGIFVKYLKSIGEEITDKSLYLLSLLQKVGEDKIIESIGYNNSLYSNLQTLTVRDVTRSPDGIPENAFKECLGLSVFMVQAIIFAFNTFRKIWGRVKEN